MLYSYYFLYYSYVISKETHDIALILTVDDTHR